MCIIRNSILLIIIFTASNLLAAKFTENFESYFASIKSSEVNVRKGPNTRYPIEWVYTKKGEPVEVIAQFEHWFRIKDFNGEEGWVKSVMVSSKKRTGIIIAKQEDKSTKSYAKLFDKPELSAKVIANIETSKRVDISKCIKNWCQIKVSNVEGWLEKANLWGVYPKEEFK